MVPVARAAKKEIPILSFISHDIIGYVQELKRRSGKDIWIFGGGELFRYLVDAGLVDSVEVAIMPILLGGVSCWRSEHRDRRWL